MEKIYNPNKIEQEIYDMWEKNGYFKPNGDITRKKFCIVLPPPNITGNLHMGHAFQQTIIDTLIRYHRMNGENTLWQTGIDHAGIATQIIVEKKINFEEEKNRKDFSRNEFIKKIWQWKQEAESNIDQQMRRLGNSIDWDRKCFSMDENFSHAVKKVFIKLYKNKLIYRGKRLVNWDPSLSTAVSDLEVKHRSKKGYIWYIRYPLYNIKTLDGKNYLIVATTRPETILGDTAIAVNPNDTRYNNLIGSFAITPLINRKIPIIGDCYADLKKGTGCVKITPAHDFNDYELARRHNLYMINIFTLDGNICKFSNVYKSDGTTSDFYKNNIPDALHHVNRFIARKKIVKILDEKNLLEKNEPYELLVSYSDRSGTQIEQMLTDQWYIKTSLLAKNAIDAVKKGKIKFVPKQYENMYFSWMKNIKDWCISRQIWWGHRIPAWYDKNKNIYVAYNEKELRLKYNLSDEVQLRQEESVLDTWFSSALWTFVSLGWPKDIQILNTFHPTDILVSGFDIIFFWIARMIMMTMYFIKDKHGDPQIPFKTIYITGLIRDDQGYKMSKSKGNVIDPIDIIDGISLRNLLNKRTKNMIQPEYKEAIIKRTKKQFPNGIRSYSTDALRFTLLALASHGRDINWDMNRLQGYQNFCNKLWHASRFIFINTKNKNFIYWHNKKILLTINRWIFSEFQQTVFLWHDAINQYRFDLAANVLYKFIWHEFCDWYLEFVKIIIQTENSEKICETNYTMIDVLESILRLSHPMIPFITENIWKKIKHVKNISSNTIMLQNFPSYEKEKIDHSALKDIHFLKKIISIIRNIRSEMNTSFKISIRIFFLNFDLKIKNVINSHFNFLKKIVNVREVIFVFSKKEIPVSISKYIHNFEIFIPIIDLVQDTKFFLKNTQEKIEKFEKLIKNIEAKIAEKNFILKAPKNLIKKEQEKMKEYKHEVYFLEKQKSLVNKL